MFLWNLIPKEYKWTVGLKKAAWTIAKTGVAMVAGSKVGEQVSPDKWLIVTEVSAAILAGGMKLIHDWAQLKYGETKYGKWL